MSYIIPKPKITEIGLDVDAIISRKTVKNTRTMILTIDKNMIDDTDFAGLYKSIVKQLIMSDINDTRRNKTPSQD